MTAAARTPKARAVLEAASDLFYRHGIAAVGVEAIAERAGVTKRTLYQRFGSKERLVAEYLEERDRTWRAFLDREVAKAGDDPRRRLLAVFEAAAAWSAAHGHKGCAMINAHVEIDDPAHPGHAVIIGQKRWMAEMFVEMVRATGHRDPQGVGEQVMLLHEGAVVATGLGVHEAAFDRATGAVQVLLDA